MCCCANLWKCIKRFSNGGQSVKLIENQWMRPQRNAITSRFVHFEPSNHIHSSYIRFEIVNAPRMHAVYDRIFYFLNRLDVICVAHVEQHVKQKSNFGFGIWIYKQKRCGGKKIQTPFYGQICLKNCKISHWNCDEKCRYLFEFIELNFIF